jgi:hypothetical protein
MVNYFVKSILVMSLLLFVDFSQPNSTKLDCCADKEGRCTGSASCRVCTNCTRCAHCNSGGSCGVCAGGSNNNSYSTPTPVYSTPKKTNTYSGSTTNENSSKILMLVTSQELNVRSGPGSTYSVVEQLTLGDQLAYLGKTGEWIKVKVILSGNIGYVHYKFVRILE